MATRRWFSDPMSRVAVIGSGLVGRGWAIVFARAGRVTSIWDTEDGKAQAAREQIEKDLPDLAEAGLLGDASEAEVLERVEVATSLEGALEGVIHVQECAPERVEVKREVFATLDATAGLDTVLASSTSGIVASAFSEELSGRERCLVAHPLNPPHLIPLVEIVPAPWTSEDTVEKTSTLMRDVGQSPIRLRKEIPGFVVNRLQGALLGEAFRLFEDGVTDVPGIDAAVAEGLGLRWSFMGPLETIDLNAPGGIADYIEKFGVMYHGFAVESGLPREWGKELATNLEKERRKHLSADALAERSAWRDRRLAGLAAHKRRADSDGST